MTLGEKVASSRYRVGQYIPFFEKEGITCTVRTIHPDVYISEWGSSKFIKKLTLKLKLVTILQLLQRLISLPLVRKADVIIIQRPLLGISSPFLEETIARINPRVIFDIDDAIFYHEDSNKAKILNNKVSRILRASAAATCGNSYLQKYSAKFTQAHLVPTSVDTERIKPRSRKTDGDKLRIGWIGQPGNFPYITEIENVLLRISRLYHQVEFLIISSFPYKPINPYFTVKYLPWSAETEVDLLHQLDIGLMPLPDSPWSRGKCGCKLIEYSAVGIASVSSDSIATQDIVVEGETGLIARSLDDWYDHLAYLIEHPIERVKMGLAARKHVEKNYSIQANHSLLLKIYREIAESKL